VIAPLVAPLSFFLAHEIASGPIQVCVIPFSMNSKINHTPLLISTLINYTPSLRKGLMSFLAMLQLTLQTNMRIFLKKPPAHRFTVYSTAKPSQASYQQPWEQEYTKYLKAGHAFKEKDSIVSGWGVM
jgi:hypothetical protein